MTNTNRQRGKAHQKVTAKDFNGLDIGIKGGEDIYHKTFSIECKSCLRFVGEKWMNQAIENNKQKKVPIVVVHIKNKSYHNDYVIVSKKDFLNIFESVV